MEIKDILKELEYNKGYFPEKVVKEAIEKRKEITDELLEILLNVSEHVEEKAEDEYYFAHIYAMFLLARFREKQAYPIIIELITKSQKDVNNLLGDLITEDLGKIL